jgi:hypothetical protein
MQMSEYLYYEFLAVDRALDAHQVDEVRALSTRATITPTSFVNTYHWGDFHGLCTAAGRPRLSARTIDPYGMSVFERLCRVGAVGMPVSVGLVRPKQNRVPAGPAGAINAPRLGRRIIRSACWNRTENPFQIADVRTPSERPEDRSMLM